MNNKRTILAIFRSTRKSSLNLNLIKAIASLSSDNFDINILEGISDLPHFNPDPDNEEVSEIVTDFHRQLREADSKLICTPE